MTSFWWAALPTDHFLVGRSPTRPHDRSSYFAHFTAKSSLRWSWRWSPRLGFFLWRRGIVLQWMRCSCEVPCTPFAQVCDWFVRVCGGCRDWCQALDEPTDVVLAAPVVLPVTPVADLTAQQRVSLSGAKLRRRRRAALRTVRKK